MTTPTSPTDLPTYDTATPEQISEARTTAREKLDAAKMEWTPQRWAEFRAAHRRAA